VNLGFGHQHVIHSTLAKIQRVRRIIQQVRPECELELDGGIDETTAPLGKAAGANVLVAGTSIFGASSLAGHLKLSNLCWIYDNNHITIEGNTALAFTEDVATRFLGYGWNILRVGDANNRDML